MTALDLSRLTGSRPYQIHGWTLSLLCHVLVVGYALALMSEFDKPVLPSSFQWEVSLVETPSPVEPAPPEQPPAQPVVQPPRPPVKPITPIQHTVQQTVQDIAVPVETVQAVQQTTQEATTVSSVEHTEPIRERTEVEVQAAPSMVEHRAVQQRLVQYRQTQADYGWLRDALWRRIEELKRYPTQARANHWEGKVVVEVVIRNDGEVVGLKIVESSGRVILDQEALTVMRKASPLPLKHSLGRPSITLFVPISYKLEG